MTGVVLYTFITSSASAHLCLALLSSSSLELLPLSSLDDESSAAASVSDSTTHNNTAEATYRREKLGSGLGLSPSGSRWCQEGPHMLLCHTSIHVHRPVLPLEIKNLAVKFYFLSVWPSVGPFSVLSLS